MNDISLESIIVMVVYSALAITGLLGNMWVLTTVSLQLIGCAVNRGRNYKAMVHSSAYIYLLSLSIVDLISLIPVPMLVTDIYENHFPFGTTMCKLFFLCEGMNKTLSPLVLMALSIDRYIAVCHPTLHWMRQTKFSLFVVTVCATISLIFIIPVTQHASIRPMQDNKMREVSKCAVGENDKPDLIFDIMHTVICYLIPLTIICAVYLAILHKLYIHTRFSTVGQKTSISLSRVVKCSVMVVAFYFICWTPYWTMRIHYFLVFQASSDELEEIVAVSNDTTQTISYYSAEEQEPEQLPQIAINFQIAFMYLMHALPYAQSAFNWLFYAFLNRNLRNSTMRCINGTRSGATTSAFDHPGVNSTMNTSFTPIWKNIQQVGTQIKSAGIDTGNALMKMSPFRGRTTAPASSGNYLECPVSHQSSQNMLSSSLHDIPRRPSLVPRQEPSLVGKALSFTNLPQPQYQRIEQKEESSHGVVSESSSVEWL
ncbi:unnamed protein product [Caenorhabditis bovis]|uniref:G-protein coupled receptors family 1 profile domain-containing protein n=1 Tax=Caenorhabditis bovis TaxID=2654633 RepID=A0A8S1EIN5_9PELO|nr:unnamed protein product [Caenorhabditis bovis]